MGKISLLETLKFATVFPIKNFRAVISRVALPALVGWAVFFASADLYISELRSYLGLPSDRSGSVILGLVAAGLLILLMLHAMLTSAVATLVMGTPLEGQPYFRAKKREWRLYAANLRVLLAVICLVAVAVAMQLLLGSFDAALISALANTLLFGGLFVLIVRCVFFAPAIVSIESSGPIVRRAMALSRGNFWRVSVIVLVLNLPGVLIENIGERLLRGVGVFPHATNYASLADILTVYSRILPGILALVSLAYLVNVTLMTIAAAAAYRDLNTKADNLFSRTGGI